MTARLGDRRWPKRNLAVAAGISKKHSGIGERMIIKPYPKDNESRTFGVCGQRRAGAADCRVVPELYVQPGSNDPIGRRCCLPDCLPIRLHRRGRRRTRVTTRRRDGFSTTPADIDGMERSGVRVSKLPLFVRVELLEMGLCLRLRHANAC